jgi:hypothetical protein
MIKVCCNLINLLHMSDTKILVRISVGKRPVEDLGIDG